MTSNFLLSADNILHKNRKKQFIYGRFRMIFSKLTVLEKTLVIFTKRPATLTFATKDLQLPFSCESVRQGIAMKRKILRRIDLLPARPTT
jgi:hypothetical protein